MTTATLICLGAAPSVAALVLPGGALVPVVVQGGTDAAVAEVQRLGGVVDGRPAAPDGLRARVPAAHLATLCRVDGVRTVTPDGTLATLRAQWDRDPAGETPGR